MRNFTFSKKWYDILKGYPKELQYAIYVAVLEYVFSGVCVEMEPVVRMAFDFIKYDIDERTRRREAENARKKAASSEITQIPESIESSGTGENKQVSSVKELTDRYYEECTAPGAVTLPGGFNGHKFSDDRIRSLVEVSVKDLLEIHGSQPGSSGFFSELDSLVSSRFEVVCEEMNRYADYACIGERNWSDMFRIARQSRPA